jgi:oligopeptide/dipeptide ABC transporter ATP-binding protein
MPFKRRKFSTMRLIEIENLHVEFTQHEQTTHAVRGVGFHVDAGESVGIVGESGSGKSVSCMALLRLLGRTARVKADKLRLDGVDILDCDARALSALRGRSAAMVFQDPMMAFDPIFTIGHQIVETIRAHRQVSKQEARAEARELLLRVEIKNADDVLNYYPHQLSGGMLQRAMIAMALSSRPKLLIADEPTTALDVTIQAQILQLIKRLQAETGMALIMITHDLGVIAETVDRVVVMYDGQVMEQGKVDQIFDAPQNDYTKTLLASLRAGEHRTTARNSGKAEVALEITNLSKTFHIKRRGRFFPQPVEIQAVRDVNLTLPRNRIVGIVGESGSGKTTTGMMAMRLLEPSTGKILVGGTDMAQLAGAEMKTFRKNMQIVFQDSYSALDPMMTLTELIAEPLDIHRIGTPKERTNRALDWLERVGLKRTFGGRYPHELSGGQRQRVAIARALILEPKILVADEPTSALDVTVKGQIIALLKQMQLQLDLSILFISHDLRLVQSLTDHVVVMYRGRIVEQGPTEVLFANPMHPYTKVLLDAIPVAHPSQRRERTFMAAGDIEKNIPRLTRAQLGMALEGPDIPRLLPIGAGHFVEAQLVQKEGVQP